MFSKETALPRRKSILILEWLLALALLTTLVELVLIYHHSSDPLPEVRLVERTEVTVLPPTRIKVAAPDGSAGTTSQTASPATFEIPARKRNIPPLLAFENIRRLLGLLGPEDNSPEIYTLTHKRTERTVAMDDETSPASPKDDEKRMLNGSNAVALAASQTNFIPAVSSRTPASSGRPFRISLP